ncbi:transglutaminase-like domain-containing protein [Stieleria sp. TO1_6]|uniref:transglutaminase-like domain-containing protein n=1 Tax=Stieleria tagensis TaxID=2956795 RepID=UPI00209B3CD3|nr:transglutaminase-like domain-containing protein [Stieleria tagensis]MCO8120544.1 transglutaminase-like domain-containing protein [Stieleria tagensis]
MKFLGMMILAVFSTTTVSTFAQDVVTDPTASLTATQLAALNSLPTHRGAPNPRLETVRSESQCVTATMKATMTTPSMAVDTWVVVVPKVPSFDAQEVLEQTTSMETMEIVDQSPMRRPLLRSKVQVNSPIQPSTSSFETTIKVQLFSRTLRPRSRRSAPVEDLAPTQRTQYLLPDRFFDYDSANFQQWKQQHGFQRERRESEVEFAQRVFRAIATDYRYMFEYGQDRTASHLCKLNETDCGGLSILFTTVMRSEAIPARTLVGRFAESAGPSPTSAGDRNERYHVIAEFFASGIGWIPVDGASAVLHDAQQRATLSIESLLRVCRRWFVAPSITGTQATNSITSLR